MSSNVVIINRERLSVRNHVWVGHHSILDASNGLIIEEGCQLAARVHILTRGSQHSRLLGKKSVDVPFIDRKGYARGKVEIGAYTFIGTGSVVLPGITIGKGCIIGAGTVVTKSVPDYSLVTGTPMQIRGSTIDIDREFFKDEDFSDTYYDTRALAMIKEGRQLAAE